MLRNLMLFGVLTLAIVTAGCDTGGTKSISANEARSIAAEIAEGKLNQEGLVALQLDDNGKEQVARELGKLRGWNVSETDLLTAVDMLFKKVDDRSMAVAGAGYVALSGACAQPVEQANGTTGQAYVAGIQSPAPNECGTDTDDKILVFNIYWGATDPNNARYWSTLWWVRNTLALYPSGLSTNGLCTNIAHTCIGSRGTWLGPDLYSVYLWHY